MPIHHAETIYTVTLTYETTDYALSRTLAVMLSGHAREQSAENPGLDWEVATGRCTEGQPAVPEALVDELADRVEARYRERQAAAANAGT